MSDFQSGWIAAMSFIKNKIEYYLDNLENSGMSEEAKDEIRKLIKKLAESAEFSSYDDEDE